MIGFIRRYGVLAPIVLIGLLTTISFVFTAGCGYFSASRKETEQLYEDIGSSKSSFKKSMVFLPFDNNVPWSNIILDDFFSKELKKIIEKECGDVRVVLPGDPGFPDSFRQLKRQEDGEPDNYALAAAGRGSGVNLVLNSRLAGIRHIIKDTGMLWFAKQIHLARLQMNVTIWHTGTGAKLLDITIFQDIKIEEAEGIQIESEKMPGAIVLTDALLEISETAGKKTSEVLKFIPWEGYVSRVDGNRIVLPFGKASGLRKGSVLTVFNGSQETEGKSGKRFFILGAKIGKITITDVFADRSDAVLKDGGPITPDSVVRTR
jgi:hypothetical protein